MDWSAWGNKFIQHKRFYSIVDTCLGTTIIERCFPQNYCLRLLDILQTKFSSEDESTKTLKRSTQREVICVNLLDFYFCVGVALTKLQAWRFLNFIKTRLQHRCLLVKFAKFFQDNSGGCFWIRLKFFPENFTNVLTL